jgi:hypothetical protein
MYLTETKYGTLVHNDDALLDPHHRQEELFIDTFISIILNKCKTVLFKGTVFQGLAFAKLNPKCNIYTDCAATDLLDTIKINLIENIHVCDDAMGMENIEPDFIFVDSDGEEVQILRKVNGIIQQKRPMIMFRTTDPGARAFQLIANQGYMIKRLPCNMYICSNIQL